MHNTTSIGQKFINFQIHGEGLEAETASGSSGALDLVPAKPAAAGPPWVEAAPCQAAASHPLFKGNINILDRAALEATACDCCRTVQDRFDYLMGLNQTMVMVADRRTGKR
jgi:hypothetical protein